MKSHGAQDIGSNDTTKKDKNNFERGERSGKPGEQRAEDIPVHMHHVAQRCNISNVDELHPNSKETLLRHCLCGQWCYSNIETSRGNGAQCIIMRRRALPPCNRVNQGQSDKIVPSWPSRRPRRRSRQYHSHARKKKQFQKRIPHIVLGVIVNTRCSRRG